MTFVYDVALILLCLTVFALTLRSREARRLQPKRMTRRGHARPDHPWRR